MIGHAAFPVVIGATLLGASVAWAEDVMVVYDASGSMWGQIDGVAKIEIAREVMADLVDGWTPGNDIGLVAYGHRREADCGDIETVVPVGPLSQSRFLDVVNAINPLGRTPLSASVEHAAEALAYRENPATVVLISDGIENCEADPCALASQLAGQGIDFRTHVIGFDVASDEQAQLACIAENTGGIFLPASDAEELGAALAQVQSVIEEKPRPEPEPEPQPEIEANVDVTAPKSAVVGSLFEASWSETIADNDFVTIVPADADANALETYIRVRGETEGELIAPAHPGLYEVRYVLDATREAIGAAPIEVIDATVDISVADTLTAGAEFDVTWTRVIHPNDIVGIVPSGADEGQVGTYLRVRDAFEGALVAPAEPGLYEVRYVLDAGRRTIGGTGVEVVEAAVNVSAPETVAAGAAFDVGWSAVINSNDIVGIVPAGAEVGEVGNYLRVRDASQGSLVAPAAPGLYEVRYILDEGRRTMASTSVEVTEPEIALSAPEAVTAGAAFDVSWTGTVNGNDIVGVVSAGADEGATGNYVRVREADTGTLTAPSEPGLYEVRYILDEGRRTMAVATLEVTEPQASISAPQSVVAGAEFDVSWSGVVNSNDIVAIVPLGADEGTTGTYLRVRGEASGALVAPGAPGLYEVRYILEEGRRTLASAEVELTAPAVSVSGPDIVRAGDQFSVSWTETVNSNDIIAIVPAGAEAGTTGDYKRTRDAHEAEFAAPEAPGLYEVRYVLEAGRATIASAGFEVVAADAALDQGAALKVPEVARPGATITVTWTGGNGSADQRIALARAEQADFTWIEVKPAGPERAVNFTLPDEPGRYEVRYLDISGRAVLGRAIVAVE